MAVQTGRVNGPIHGRLGHRLVPGRHVPCAALSVIVDGRLKEKAVHRKKVASPAGPGTHVVFQLSRAVSGGIARSTVCQEGSRSGFVQTICNSGTIMGERSDKKILSRGPAGQ